jgi:hypothetical protein
MFFKKYQITLQLCQGPKPNKVLLKSSGGTGNN